MSNPHAFRNVVDECRRIQGDHRMVSRDLVYTSLRMRHTGISDTTQYVKAHDLWSGIARYIARYYPDIEPSMAHCTIDDAYPSLEDMPPLPEEVLA